MTPETNDAASLRLLWEDPSTGEPVEQMHVLPITIGRGNSNAIVLNSNRISREHARLEVENGQPIVRDLASTNGTSVNGQRVTLSPLNDGDLIQIGPFSLTVDVFPFYDL
ncbi:MAG: FHA domain-containing protein, partial [Anaerolineales bacterium]|nr:FHA domain-containing protein [Anaerolineales bacterium]